LKLRISYLFNGYIRWYAFIVFAGLTYVGYSESNFVFAFLIIPIIVLMASKGVEIRNDSYRKFIRILGLRFGKFQPLSDITNVIVQSYNVRVGMNSRGSSASYVETVYDVFLIEKNKGKRFWFKTNKEKVVQKLKNEFQKYPHINSDN